MIYMYLCRFGKNPSVGRMGKASTRGTTCIFLRPGPTLTEGQFFWAYKGIREHSQSFYNNVTRDDQKTNSV